MANAGLEILSAVRITRAMQALQDVRELPQQLVWLARVPSVDADDDEIMARWIQRVQIADLVSDDAQAVTYTSGKMTFYTNTAPNIKHGQQLTQSQIRQITDLARRGGDVGPFLNMEANIIDSLLLGIRQRQEALILAMLMDSFSYDRFGIKMSGITWGMPADLKITVSTGWDDTVNATPVTDVLTVKRLAQVRYGVVLDRITISLAGFLAMIATSEFIERARTFLAPNVSFVNLATQNTDYMMNLARSVFGVEFELYDSRYWSSDEEGTVTSAPFLPINEILFTSKSDDGNSRVRDWANGVTTESQIAPLARNSSVGRIPAGTRGPISYATVPEELNPPQVTYWGVARGFPRRHMLANNAVLNIGNISESIPVGVPF